MVPTRINADKMNFDYSEGVIYLRGHVVVADPQGMLYADNATVYLEKNNEEENAESDSEKDKNENIQIDENIGTFYRVVAFGNVRMTTDDRAVISNKAVWDREKNTIVLTGGPPMLKQGASYIEATRIVYNISTGQTEFFPNPRVVINNIDQETKNKFLR